MGTVSPFWYAYAAGAYTLDSAFGRRDAIEVISPAEMRAWLALTERERGDIVEAYARSRPIETRLPDDRRSAGTRTHAL